MIQQFIPPAPTTTPPWSEDRPYWSPHRRGHAALILNLGHAEYDIPALDTPSHEPLKVEDWCRDTNGSDLPGWMQDYTCVPQPLDYDIEWSTFVRITGDVVNLWRWFYLFVNRLDPQMDPTDYTPGGDDDTFDYYPSAWQCAEEWATDLDNIERHFMMYVEDPDNPTLAQVSSPDGALPLNSIGPRFDIRRKFTARHRLVEIARNVALVRDIDHIEADYLRPYLTDATDTPDASSTGDAVA